MTLNTKKSVGLTIVKDGKRKNLVLLPHRYGTPGGTLPPMGINDKQKYLGIEFSWKGRVTPKQTAELERMLKEITEAPLKPFQRMDIVRTFAIPRLTHKLVLGCAHRNTLAKMDRMVRKATRAWLRLPKDTPLGFLHSTVI